MKDNKENLYNAVRFSLKKLTPTQLDSVKNDIQSMLLDLDSNYTKKRSSNG